ncbi:MAG: hypothetical protein GY705_06860 [Bacteroidetes bacterium]|nr:hypothetical protein [Bacteroidota bacterium]
MKVAIFLDGRPGHEKQTLGIVRELGCYTEVTTRKIAIPRNNLLQQIVDCSRYMLGWCDSAYSELGNYDLLIGTGTATHLPMLMCKKKYHVPVITCMTPSTILMRKFDLCCVPQHDGIHVGKNIFQTIGPPNCSEARKEHVNNKAMILIGGVDHKSHHWNTDDVERQITRLLSENKNMQWTISTSPRTPNDTSDRIKNVSEEYNNSKFFDFKDTPAGWVEKEYNLNKTVWVTADSMSMVYEALSAGCNVGILPVRWKKNKSKFIRSEKFLVEQKIVLSFDTWLAGESQWPGREPLNEAKKCAEEILRRWKQKN